MKHGHEKTRVVVVDDERDFLELMRAWLTPKYDVSCFTDGEGIIERLDAIEPDILILDVHMPGMDGFALCRRVRSVNRFAFLPIVFLTASKQDVDFLRTLDAGANSYLNKPITQRELDFRIREILMAQTLPSG